jgi:diaminopimelate epimerase
MMKPHFHKYTAMGNDMLIIDPHDVAFQLTEDTIRKICDRNFGIGSDGICYGPLTDVQPYAMRFYNPDGSEAEKSGNGLRIFARYLCDAGYVEDTTFSIEIMGQVSQVSVLDEQKASFKIEMGQATFASDQIPMVGDVRVVVAEPLTVNGDTVHVTCVNVGNPHCVIFTDALSVTDVKRLGAQLERHAAFPERTNVQWVQVIDKHTICIEIWERGAGYTLASGTSSCATACASIINGYCESPITVQMAGGQAVVDVQDDWQIELTGTVQSVASGVFSPSFLATFD